MASHLLGKVTIIVTILLMSKWRLREGQGLAQGHTMCLVAELGLELCSGSHPSLSPIGFSACLFWEYCLEEVTLRWVLKDM